ncbi:DNA-binding protein [Lysobacter humi (ex Lee et al. 2017)]
MARGITQFDVDQAAEALLMAGERPTIDRVRQHLGTGSPNTVTRLLDVWWKALGPRLSAQRARVPLPDAPEAVASLAAQLWEQALASAGEHAQAALADDRAALAAHRAEADARVAAAHQALEAAQEAEARALAALSAAQERQLERQRVIDQQAGQLDDLTRQRDEALQRLAGQDAEIAALRARLETHHVEAAAEREAQATHLRAVEDRAHREIDRARQEARELKQRLAAAEKAHAARVRQLDTELSEVRTAAAQLAKELSAEQARRETLEAQQAALRRSLEVAIAPAPPGKRARAPTSAKPRPARGAKHAGAKTSK